MTMQWRKTLLLFKPLFDTQQFLISRHVTNSTGGCMYVFDNLVTLRAEAIQVSSSFRSSFASSAFMTPIPGRVQWCSSRTLWCIYNQCNYIPATPSPEYISGYLSRVFRNLCSYILCSHDVVQCSRGTIWFRGANETLFVRAGHWVCVLALALAAHGMESGEFTQSCGCAA